MKMRSSLLGFAFAASDLLIELDGEGRVVEAMGSAPGPGCGLDDLRQGRFADHLGRASAHALSETLNALGPGRRSEAVEVLIAVGPERTRRASVRMFAMPALAPRVSCAVRYEGPAFALRGGEPRPAVTPVDFLNRARERLERPGEAVDVAFVDLAGMAEAETHSPGVGARINDTLQAASADGASATRLSGERFAVLRRAGGEAELKAELDEVLRDEGLALPVQVRPVPLTAEAPLNALRALRFAVEDCLANGAAADPSAAFGEAMKRTVREAEAFRAMVRDRAFALHYQPIVDLKTGAVHHHEALARFPGSTGPAGAIRMAEEIGLIEGFDLAVAEKALARLRRPGAGLVKIAVNVSGASLTGDGYVQALLRMTEMSPELRRRLIVEVTETSALADVSAANRRLGLLRQAGMRVCIDDFGAGAASLDYLRGLAVDAVKIDGKLVQALNDERTLTMVRHVVELCASLGVETIAEMVETDAAADQLRAMGVDYAQGWLFGRAEVEPAVQLGGAAPARRMGAVEAWG